jgi:hypothetical protein
MVTIMERPDSLMGLRPSPPPILYCDRGINENDLIHEGIETYIMQFTLQIHLKY